MTFSISPGSSESALEVLDRIWGVLLPKCVLRVSRAKIRRTCLFWPGQQIRKFLDSLEPDDFYNKAEHVAKTKLLPPNDPVGQAGSHGDGFTARKSRIA